MNAAVMALMNEVFRDLEVKNLNQYSDSLKTSTQHHTNLSIWYADVCLNYCVNCIKYYCVNCIK